MLSFASRLRARFAQMLLALCALFLVSLPHTTWASDYSAYSQCVEFGGTEWDCRALEITDWNKFWPDGGGTPGAVYKTFEEAAVAARTHGPTRCNIQITHTPTDWATTASYQGHALQQKRNWETISSCAVIGSTCDCSPHLSLTTLTRVSRQRDLACPMSYTAYSKPGIPGICYRAPRPDTQCTRVGNPIGLLSQAKLQTESALIVGALWDRLSFSYASTRAGLIEERTATYMGWNWRIGFDHLLKIDPNGTLITYRNPTGELIGFTKQTDGSWKSRPPHALRLSAISTPGPDQVAWRFTDANNQVLGFDTAGALRTLQTASGTSLTLSYALSGRLNRVADAFGRYLDLAYSVPSPDRTPRLSSITGSDGAVLTFLYDEDYSALLTPDNLTSIRFADGSKRQYLYQTTLAPTLADRVLKQMRDENGNVRAEFTYDAYNRATHTAHAGGVNTWTVNYADWYTHNTVIVNNPLGAQFTYAFFYTVYGGYKLKSVTMPDGTATGTCANHHSFDDNGNVLAHTDFLGKLSCHSYDARNLETQRDEGRAGQICPGAANPESRTVRTQWHPDWRLQTRQAAPKRLTTWIYNGQPDPTNSNTITTCAPGSALIDGKPIAVLCKKIEQSTTDPNGAAGFNATATNAPRIWSYTYNSLGQRLTSNGPRGDVSDTATYTYYTDSNTDHTAGDLQSVTNAAGHLTRYTKYNKRGQPLEIISPNEATTTLTYHPRGWLTQSTLTTGNTSETTRYEYDAAGQLKKAILPDDSFLTYTHDAAHRLTAITDKAGNSIHYTLDAMGNRIKEETKDSTGSLARQLSRIMDPLNRVQSITGGNE